MSGSRFCIAIRWERSTFLHVMGKKAPALMVASLAMIITCRPATLPIPHTTLADGDPPHSWYIPRPAHNPISSQCESASNNRTIRSRAVSRPFLCCRSMALTPPPISISEACEEN